MIKRKMVKINQELCTGCGLCVTPCAEGAITLVDGKAKVVREELCDGAGYCLAVCPAGALTIEERVTEEFNEHAVEQVKAERRAGLAVVKCKNCGTSEYDQVLLPIRSKGESEWICVKCLPRLIHG
ncbi:MAG: ATP-binding protein [Carboxydocellales bacterium]